MMKRLLILFGLTLILFSFGFGQTVKDDSLTSEIQLRTYLAKDAVPLNKEVVYFVELSWPGPMNRYHILKISDPVLTNLKLRGSGSSNRFYIDKNKQPHSLKKITFYFTPLEMGMAYVDGITIKYEDTVTRQTGRLISQRLPVKIVEPVSRPGQGINWGKTLIIALIILFLLTVIFSLYRYFLQKKKQETEEEPQLTIEEEFLKELKESIRLSEDIPEKNFNGLQHLLDRYLKKKFGLPSGTDFPEIKTVLQAAGLKEEFLAKLEQVFRKAELVKFAGEPVSETDLHLFIDTVELILTEMNKRNNLSRNP